MPPSPAAGSPQVQVFGRETDRPTRAALRFFKERRIAIHFVDLRRKPIAPGELRRFIDRLGVAAVVDTTGPAYRAAGLAYLRMDDAEIVERLLADQRLLRLPLVRRGSDVSAGPADGTWKSWLAGRPARDPASDEAPGSAGRRPGG